MIPWQDAAGRLWLFGPDPDGSGGPADFPGHPAECHRGRRSRGSCGRGLELFHPGGRVSIDFPVEKMFVSESRYDTQQMAISYHSMGYSIGYFMATASGYHWDFEILRYLIFRQTKMSSDSCQLVQGGGRG